jgi:hypothetical protein
MEKAPSALIKIRCHFLHFWPEARVGARELVGLRQGPFESERAIDTLPSPRDGIYIAGDC